MIRHTSIPTDAKFNSAINVRLRQFNTTERRKDGALICLPDTSKRNSIENERDDSHNVFQLKYYDKVDIERSITQRLGGIIPENMDLTDTSNASVQAVHAFFQSRGMTLTALPSTQKGQDKPGTRVTQAATHLEPDFPKTAPEKWEPKPRGHKYQQGEETPEAFAVRVYGRWMTPDAPHQSISMAEIFNLDKQLYHSLRRSQRHEKPDGLFLPSKKEKGTAELHAKAVGQLQPPVGYNERQRLFALARRRKGKDDAHNR